MTQTDFCEAGPKLKTLSEIYPYVFCINVYLQLRYISAMDEPVLRPKLMTRSRLWPEQDVNKIAAWMYTPSSSVSLSSYFISPGKKGIANIVHVNKTKMHLVQDFGKIILEKDNPKILFNAEKLSILKMLIHKKEFMLSTMKFFKRKVMQTDDKKWYKLD